MLMKLKTTVLMLAVALAIPFMSQADVKSNVQECRKATNVVMTTPTVKPISVVKHVTKATKAVAEGYAQVTLTIVDNPNYSAGSGVWGDGSGYQMLLDADATAYGSIIPETGGFTTGGDASAESYAEFEYKIPENADGALTTTNMIISGTQSITIPAGTYDWCITNPTPGDRLWIASANGTVPGRYDDFVFESGAAYTFTVSFGGQNDQVDLEIDDPTAPTIPTELAANPAATSAEITWTPGENNDTWNLRYRPYVEGPQNQLWDFAEDTYEAQLDGWMAYDADGDGYNWGLQQSNDGNIYFVSKSYYSGSALTPDNWLFTPEVDLGGTLKFDAWQGLASWPDKIMVYVCTNPEWETVDEFTAISDFIVPSSNSPESFEVDLSAYEGTGIIAFRHYDCTDQYYIALDNIEILVPNPVVIPDWTVIEQVSSPYELQGLTPVTEYEVQVQGVKSDSRLTDWTESVRFTTLEEGEQPVKYYLVGGFNGWNADEAPEITEEGVTIDVQAQNFEDQEDTAQEFKLITMGEDDWIWLGGIDENGVGYFDLTNEMLEAGTEITIDDAGANFRLPAAGNYTIKLVEETGEPSKAPVEGIKMVVVKNDSPGVAVTDINGKVVKSIKYVNLAGVESAQPFDGVNIVVTTFSDGTKAAAKVIK